MKNLKNNQLLLGFISWKSVLFIIAFLSTFIVSLKNDFIAKNITHNSLISSLWPWANFDGEHYISIVANGYGQYEYAFFPLYPALIKTLTYLNIDPLTGGLLISNMAALIFIFLVYKLWLLDFNKGLVFKALLSLAVFPTAFYLGALYTEGLFLMLVVGSFYAFRKDKLWIVALLGILACMTRLVGIFLIPSFLVAWYFGERKPKNLLPIFTIGIGFLLVLLFDYLKTGDPLYFFHVQPLFGANRSGGEIILLPQTLFRYIKIFMTTPLNWTYYVAAQEFILTVGSLLVLALSYKKIRLEYLVFCLGVIIVPTLTGTLSSMPRYILGAFPLFIALPLLIKSRVLLGLVLTLFVLILIINISLFVNGYWVS